MSLQQQHRYRTGEWLVVIESDVVQPHVLGVYRCRRNLDIPDLLNRFYHKFGHRPEQEFLDFLVDNQAIEKMTTHVVPIDCTVGLTTGGAI